LIIGDHQKTIQIIANLKFSQVCQILYNNTDQMGEISPLISEEMYNMSIEYKDLIDNMIDDKRDFLIDYFGFKTLAKSYLLKVANKVVETPQHMFMRVALGEHGRFKYQDKVNSKGEIIEVGATLEPDFELIKETYDLESMKFFTHATPTLYNAGTRRPQFFSCFLNGMDDSLKSIYKVLGDCADISKWSGGIGLHIHEIRSNQAYIRGTGGRSDGIVPMLKVYNDTARYVNQCFAKETIIPTTNGLKRFDEIVIGDSVITGKGTVEYVSKIFRTSNLDDSKLFGITIKHSIEPTWVTGSHPIYCIQDQAKELDYYDISNRLEKGIIEADFVAVKDLKIDDFLGFPIPMYEQDIPEYTKEDCRFFGVMLGDGHISKDGDQAYICGNPEKDDFNFYNNYLLSTGCKITKTERNDKYHRLTFTPQTASMFKFGRVHLYQEDEKHIHSSFLHLPIEKALQIVYGVLETDGHIGNDIKETEIVLEMTSKNVIDSIKYILLRAGVLTSGSIVDRVGESHETEKGIITSKKIAYRLRIPKIKVICDLLGLKYSSEKSTQFCYNNYIFSRIKRIESKLYKGAVYDLETLGPEHTYLTPLGIAHNGGGKRSGSFAIYLETWHADIQDFLKCKLPHGDENRRARDLFYALWISDLFMERVKANESWSLMCPSECPGLADVYGKDFKKLYEKYEKEGRVVKSISAQELWYEILKSQIETGTPYMTYKDAANYKSNQKNVGTIKSSNLCSEIMEYSDTEKYACCVLASMVLPTYVVPAPITKPHAKSKKSTKDKTEEIEEIEVDLLIPVKETKASKKKIEENEVDVIQPELIFDHAKLGEVVKVVTRNLNKLIDLNYYPVEETRVSNMSERPIGIGIQGLADVFFKLGMPYDSPEAIKLDREIMETIYYYAISASMELSKKDGPYPTFKGSPISKGHFQFDLWKEFPTSKEHIPEILHSGRYDWDKLRREVKKHGVRNSLVTALMPTATTSQIMGSAMEAFEPITSNCYARRVKAGEFMVVNPYLAADLIKLGLWNENMRNNLLQTRGSVQNIPEIPKKLKDIYKTVWEIQQKVLIDHSIARGPYVDQSQSLNLYFADGNQEMITKAHFYGWSRGLKTGSYYIRTKPSTNSASFTMTKEEEPEKEKERSPNRKSAIEITEEEDQCNSCGS
jgi:ribonucleoside-diphosphate reductase alpha subunit